MSSRLINNGIENRVGIICQVYGTSLERIRRFKRLKGNDLKALIEIATFLRNEEFKSYEEIGDLLFRDRTTIQWHLKPKVNKSDLSQLSQAHTQ